MTAGHVYVIHGRLETVDADVVVVPTDESFRLEKRWLPVLQGAHAGGTQKPINWQRGAVHSLPLDEPDDTPQLWFIDVAQHQGESAEDTVAKIVDGVGRIIGASGGIVPHRNRQLPLIAIPTLGVSGGGLASVRGQLIRRLLQQARESAEQHEVDIVMVALNRADHAAFQHLRRELHPLSNDTALDRTARSLATKARSGQLALFIGAGVSMSAGLPSWTDLLDTLQRGMVDPLQEKSGLNELDIAELIERETGSLKASTVSAIGKPMRAGLSHFLLADLRCEQVVTTNFDPLYELSARAGVDRSVRVLPWESVDDRGPWILKMHGDVEHPDTIILSRSDFIRYGSSHGPAGAVLQSLMLSRHLLVVGASLTDDNFLRLAYEVEEYVAKSAAEPRILGTVVTHQPEPARQRLFNGIFDYVDASQGASANDSGRALSIFLDAVAMYATLDSPFLLDPAYRSLLDDRSQALAAELRRLQERVIAQGAETGGAWAALARSLSTYGAESPHPPTGT